MEKYGRRFFSEQNTRKGCVHMKKYLISLAVALMVCLLGITASAETVDEASKIVFDALHEHEEDGTLNSAETEQIVKAAFVSEGWTVVDDSGISAQSAENDIDPEVLELAYMDIDKADSELKEKILDARKTVIYSFSWVNDIDVPGAFSYSANPDTREVSFDPLFSELFPGWDVPRNQCDLSNVPIIGEENDSENTGVQELEADITESARAITNPLTHTEVRYVPKATSEVATPFWGTPIITNHTNEFKLWASSFLTSGMTTINYGLSTNTGVELNHRLRTYAGEAFAVSYNFPAASSFNYSTVLARASTYAQPGNARIYFKRTIDV